MSKIQNYIVDHDIFLKLGLFILLFAVILTTVFGLNYLMDYLESLNMLDDSIRKNIGVIIGVFVQ